MKNTVRAALAALLLLGLPAFAGAQVKLALLDSRVLLENAPGSAQAKTMLDNELAGFQSVVSRWSDSLNALKKTLNDQEATLSPAARAAKQKEIDDRLERYQKGNDSLTKIMQRRQAEVMQPVLDLVNKVINDIRMEDGYAIIWDLATDAQSVVAYDKNLDITDKVVARVKRLPAPALPAAAKPAAGAPKTNAAGVKPPPPAR